MFALSSIITRVGFLAFVAVGWTPTETDPQINQTLLINYRLSVFRGDSDIEVSKYKPIVRYTKLAKLN